MSSFPPFVRLVGRHIELRVRNLLGSQSARFDLEYSRLRRLGNCEAVTHVLGAPLRLSNATSFEGMHREIFVREIFNFEASSSSPRFIDCGANIGMASIYLGLRHPQARITAFEADPCLAAFAMENLAAFEISHTDVVPAAVASHDGTVTFHATGDVTGRVGREEGITPSITKDVRAVALAPYLDEPVEFLKIDIEGTEFEVLTSASDRLRNVKRMFVEFHGFASEDQRLPEFLQLLSDVGFRYYITNAYDFRRKPLKDSESHCGMDVQLNIFCVRLGQ